MTLIGAIPCNNGVVVLADRQETLTDYAKWDVNKIAHFELQNNHRCLMAGCGDSDIIEMIKQHVIAAWSGTNQISANYVIKAVSQGIKNANELRAAIIRIVATITKKCILPFPRNDRPYVELIWAIQQISPQNFPSIDVFRTYRLSVESIGKPYFAGSPVILIRYLSDMYLHNVSLNTEEAEALAAYLLWEAKDYDPNVGKHSDIITLRQNGTLGRLDRASEKYWEEHFAHFKKSLRLLPLLSCTTSAITKNVYPLQDHLQRFKAALETLVKQQEKMRKANGPKRSKLEEALNKNLRKAALKFQAQERTRLERSSGQMSKGLQ